MSIEETLKNLGVSKISELIGMRLRVREMHGIPIDFVFVPQMVDLYGSFTSRIVLPKAYVIKDKGECSYLILHRSGSWEMIFVPQKPTGSYSYEVVVERD